MTQIKMERDIKEKEAAAHLIEVERKAQRVDELERKYTLLEMDKDQMKHQIGKLRDQLEAANGGTDIKPR